MGGFVSLFVCLVGFWLVGWVGGFDDGSVVSLSLCF